VKLVILGAGALGSIVAAHLTKAGGDVVLIARGARAELLKNQGMTIKGLSDLSVRVPVTDRPQDLKDADVLLVAVKTYDNEAALQGVRHLQVGSALSLQNGVLKNEQLAGIYGADKVLGCIADFSGEVQADGTVLFTRNDGLYIGEIGGDISDRVSELAAVLNQSGIKAIPSEQIQTLEWSKLVAWLGYTPVAVLSRLVTHRVLQDPDLARLLVSITREAAEVAAKSGVPVEDMGGMLLPKTLSTLSPDEAVALVQQMGRGAESAGVVNHKMSALQDLERGRHLEVEETLGYTVRRAAELGLPVPGLETCYRLLAAIDRNLG
jgi:2-dehydropantoate 2-reductase